MWTTRPPEVGDFGMIQLEASAGPPFAAAEWTGVCWLAWVGYGRAEIPADCVIAWCPTDLPAPAPAEQTA